MDPLPDDVQRFLAQNIESLEQLDILRLLDESPEREWTAEALAVGVQAPPRAVLNYLAGLQGKGLLTMTLRGEDKTWRHGSATPDLDRQVTRVLEQYRQRPVTMIKLVYARTTRVLETLAEAFRFRKDG